MIAALFTHHRDLVPWELERRLLPVVIPPEPTRRQIWKQRKKHKIIYLPDLSGVEWVPRLPPKRKATLIIKEVCERHGITVARFFGADRHLEVCLARHEACYLVAKNTEMSIPAIGMFMKKDHSTIMNSIEVHCKRNNLSWPRRRQREVVQEACCEATA